MNTRFSSLKLSAFAAAALLAFGGATFVQAQQVVVPDTVNESDQPVTDTWITTKVKTELLADTAVKGTDINVSTTDGVVTLAGVLDSKAAVDQAIKIAKGTKGVKSVDTQALKVR